MTAQATVYVLAFCFGIVSFDLWVIRRRHGQAKARADQLAAELEEARRAEQAPARPPLRREPELTDYGWQRIGEILAIAPQLRDSAALNGRVLADLLRGGSLAPDVSIAGHVLVLLDFAMGLHETCRAHEQLPEAFVLMSDALAMAAVELTSLERATSPDRQ